MRLMKGIIIFCFIAITAFVFLAYIQLPEIKEYQLEMSESTPLQIGLRPVDVIVGSFYYMIKSPTITSGLLVFMYFVGIAALSYIGSILGLLVAIVERGQRTDFLFMLSFITCLFFAIFTTIVAILV